ARIRVQRRTLDLQVASVEEEALVGVEVELTNAECNDFIIDRLSVAEQYRMNRIHRRMIEVPPVRLRDRSLRIEIGGCTRADGRHRRGEDLNPTAVQRQQRN